MLQIKGESAHRVMAYRRAGETIAELSRDLYAVHAEGRLTELPYIGKTLANKIDEIVATGKLEFYERLSAEVPSGVVEMLNICLRHQADLVDEFGGDIDKFVGDELIAVFHGDDMVVKAVECAMAIQEEMARLQEKHPHWNVAVGIGINAGEVVMGAVGSEDRMDFTILGDNVNLGARLCSAAGRDQILLSNRAAKYLSDWNGGRLVALEPIKVKGKDQAIPIFEVKVQT